MKKICLIIFIAMCLSRGFAQVAINSNNAAPHPSAMLDIQSVNRGLLIPRYTTSARAGINSPAKGLIVYDSTLSAFFYYTGASWTQLTTGSGSWNVNGNDIYNANTGNVGIGKPNPAKPLDVEGAGGIQISNGANASSDNELFFTDNGQIRSLDNFHRIVFNRSSDQLEFNELGRILFKTGDPVNEAMRVASDGKVGIGTTNPNARLHVVDAVNSSALLVESGSSSPVITINNSGGGSASIDSKVNNVWKSSITGTPQGDLVLNNAGGSMRLQSNGNVGIGTSSPNASAILELAGTNKGFLPPKMTQVQRDLISSPSEGLVVYNTSTHMPNYFDGQIWWNYDGTAAGIQIGVAYQGGIVAYILQLNDPGYDPNVIHGLIAAASDQSTGAEWGCYNTLLIGATGTALGTGNQNTTDILSGCATTGIAAKLCGDLVLNSYSDWYLPSKDELNKLYIKRGLIGGFAGFVYWSSSQNSANTAWGQDFSDGFQFNGLKNQPGYVRAIRSF